MKQSFKKFIPRTLITLFALLIALCFVLSVVTIENYAKDECFRQIEETAAQITTMFTRALIQTEDHLMLFADILASNSHTDEGQLLNYMENFCNTQSFDAVCLHRRDGTSFSYGPHPAHDASLASFEAEVIKTPYISNVYAVGERRTEQYVYMAVPVMSDEETVAVLYGYMPLDVFPSFITSTAYGGKCRFYIVDGNNGNYLMDEYHRYVIGSGDELPLGNVFTGGMANQQTRPGYHISHMREDMAQGKSGYYIFKSLTNNQWYYTYYMPMEINNWSMQLTIDEPIAFATYYDVRNTVFTQMICVVVLAIGILAVIMWKNRQRRERDAANLHKADYLNAIQAALITAHNNPDFVGQALKLVAREIQAETALLLTFARQEINDVYYWPSTDKSQAMAMIGLNIRETFPVLYDSLVSKESLFCDEATIAATLSDQAQSIFSSFDIHNILLVPIADNTGTLKGAIAAVNINGENKNSEMLELVTRDFYMAINNLEKHNIIRKMGAMDYLTGIKNRNSFEAESPAFETLPGNNLWCIYVDVNGLHETNNEKGHAAGDALLCNVASAVRKIFGSEHSYRLGGDEFVAFRLDSSHEEFMSYKYRLLDELSRKGYSVSAGFEGTVKNENNIFDVAKLMADAESIMYQEKKKYYMEHGNLTSRASGMQPWE